LADEDLRHVALPAQLLLGDRVQRVALLDRVALAARGRGHLLRGALRARLGGHFDAGGLAGVFGACAITFESAGSWIFEPTLSALGCSPPLSAWISLQRCSLPSVRRAIEAKLSPFCTVYSRAPAGMGGVAGAMAGASAGAIAGGGVNASGCAPGASRHRARPASSAALARAAARRARAPAARAPGPGSAARFVSSACSAVAGGVSVFATSSFFTRPVKRDQKPGDLLSPQKETATMVTSRKTRAITP
jgi:hypothetical protein